MKNNLALLLLVAAWAFLDTTLDFHYAQRQLQARNAIISNQSVIMSNQVYLIDLIERTHPINKTNNNTTP